LEFVQEFRHVGHFFEDRRLMDINASNHRRPLQKPHDRQRKPTHV
jgi:hypothetical protein